MHLFLKPLLLAALLAPVAAQAQAPEPAATPRPTPIVSPEVHADGRVTFRLKAPEAARVKVGGEWDGPEQEMARGADGVWSATVGPVPPDIYGYSFHVDGVPLLDPSNTWAKPARSVNTSVLEVPQVLGAPPVPYDPRLGVPRGTLHLHEYDSRSLNRARRLRVYTPAVYDTQRRTRFPVLYLLHGSGDNEATWTEFGRAHVILDNLIAARQAVPMIVVMTDGHALTSTSTAPASTSSTSPAVPSSRLLNARAFERDLLQDVMPLVESRYRTRAERNSRAIAGLSMGGNQALIAGLNNRGHFAWVGAMSSAIREPEASLSKYLQAPNDPRVPLRLLWIAIGKDDFLLKENRTFNALLSEKKVPHEYIETEGAHKWPVWRRYLAALAPRLFRP